MMYEIITSIEEDDFTATSKSIIDVYDDESCEHVAVINVDDRSIEFENQFMRYCSEKPSFIKLFNDGFTSKCPWCP